MVKMFPLTQRAKLSGTFIDTNHENFGGASKNKLYYPSPQASPSMKSPNDVSEMSSPSVPASVAVLASVPPFGYAFTNSGCITPDSKFDSVKPEDSKLSKRFSETSQL